MERECLYEVLGEVTNQCQVKNESIVVNFALKKIHFMVTYNHCLYKIQLRFNNILNINFAYSGGLVIMCEGKVDELIRISLLLKHPL